MARPGSSWFVRSASRAFRRRPQPEAHERRAPDPVAGLRGRGHPAIDRVERRVRPPSEDGGLGHGDRVRHREIRLEPVGVDRLEPVEGVADVAAAGDEPRPHDREIRRAAAALVEREPLGGRPIGVVPAAEPQQDVPDEGCELHPVAPLETATARGLLRAGGHLERLLEMVRREQVQGEVVAGDDGELRRLAVGQAMRLAQLLETCVELAERDEVRAEHRPCPALLEDRPGRLSAVDRGLADGPRFRPAAQAHQRPAQPAEDGRAFHRRRLGRHELDRPAMLDQRSLALATGPHQEGQPRMQRAR